MLDPVVCADMRTGAPQVSFAALSDLKRLVTSVAVSTNSPSENGLAWEEVDETEQRARTNLEQTDEPDIRALKVDGMSAAERAKTVMTLAQILMQAAGLVVEEFGDE